MIDNGLEAVLIKVAGAGLTEKHLGKSLAQMQPTLHKLVSDLQRSRTARLMGLFSEICSKLTYAERAVNMKL